MGLRTQLCKTDTNVTPDSLAGLPWLSSYPPAHSDTALPRPSKRLPFLVRLCTASPDTCTVPSCSWCGCALHLQTLAQLRPVLGAAVHCISRHLYSSVLFLVRLCTASPDTCTLPSCSWCGCALHLQTLAQFRPVLGAAVHSISRH
jgi:ABC-type cobalamin transport system permease subunit